MTTWGGGRAPIGEEGSKVILAAVSTNEKRSECNELVQQSANIQFFTGQQISARNNTRAAAAAVVAAAAAAARNVTIKGGGGKREDPTNTLISQLQQQPLERVRNS